MEKVDPTIGFPLVSINSASTLQLYCSHHDSDLFREVEASRFQPNARTAGLLHFRGVCRETLTKIGANITSSTIDSSDPELELLKIGQRIGLRDAAIHYHHELRRIGTNDFSELRYYVCEFDQELPFAAVGAFLPEIDLEGNALADLADFSTTPESVGIACFSDNERGYLALTWDVRGLFARQVAASFHRLSESEKADAALTMAFEFIENVALSPDWWEGLAKRDRMALLRRHQIGGSPYEERPPTALISRSHVLPSIRAKCWHSNEGLFYVLR